MTAHEGVTKLVSIHVGSVVFIADDSLRWTKTSNSASAQAVLWKGSIPLAVEPSVFIYLSRDGWQKPTCDENSEVKYEATKAV